MDTICVMMSTYNGEKYLNEQIDSIINQKDVNIYLLIRDDGSNDGTAEILQQYNLRYPDKIEIMWGENIGCIGSFYELTYYAYADKQFDFFAYADQDDVWMSDKLILGVSRLKQYEKEPAFFYADRLVVDEDKRPLYRVGQQEFLVKRGMKKKVLAPGQVFSNGCTQIFNRELLEISTYAEKSCLVSNKIAHDQWMAIAAAYFAKVEYDCKICIFHRQHENSISNSGKRRTRSFALRYVPYAKVFANTYLNSGLLQKEDAVFLTMILEYKSNFKYKLKLLLDSDLRYKSFLGSVKFKIAILLSCGL